MAPKVRQFGGPGSGCTGAHVQNGEAGVKRLLGDQQVRTLGDLIEIGVRAEMENVGFEKSLNAESDDDSESDDDGLIAG